MIGDFFSLGGWLDPLWAMRPDEPAAEVAVAAAADDPAVTRGQARTPFGNRDYLLFTPLRPATRPILVVMLHGCGQDAAAFMNGTGMNTAAANAGAHVLWPEQDRAANVMRCWNWFERDNQRPDTGEAALLMTMIDQTITQKGLAGADIFVGGMSAGGAMAATLADLFPKRISAVGVHSGLRAMAADSVSSAMTVMREGAGEAGTAPPVPAIIFHGDADDVVAPVNGTSLAANIEGRVSHGGRAGQHRWTRRSGDVGEYWQIHGMGHAWSGGNASVDHNDAAGPDASAEMMRFFLSHR
ncbi:MAG: poly(3-hydroxyalkanoate) depolymerase [Paracoccus denitrificans]|nr:MAG: poly(3-hydroxyalkanoate) depolymerase [Paracoccus denitrificans]PZO86234.1 MAG: poly(3-hydroxyalkanoate) depolymerase [Paracoccus denitrificans]